MSEWLLHIRKGEGRAKRRTKAAILSEANLRQARIDTAILAGTRGADYVIADWVLGGAEVVYGEGVAGRCVLLRNMKRAMTRLGYTPMANPRCAKGTWRLHNRDYTVYRKLSCAPLTRYAQVRSVFK